jgi:uncharacterized delta-60 repeat protein
VAHLREELVIEYLILTMAKNSVGIKIFLISAAVFLLAGCGSGLCPMGSAYRTSCPIVGSGSYGAIGLLDTSFGGTGYTITNLPGGLENVASVQIDTSGKIYAAGYSVPVGTINFVLLRYLSDGNLDSTFNTTGYVVTDIAPGLHDQAMTLAIQSDGKIIVGGAANNGTNFDATLARYHTNGSLDTTFNATGYVLTDFGFGSDYINSVAIQTDGKIIGCGSATTAGLNEHVALARYHSNGSLDTTFNTTGRVVTPATGFTDYCYNVIVQPDGKIIAAGGSYDGGFEYDTFLFRFHPNGSLDTTFNGTGKVISTIGTDSAAYQALLDSNNKILVGGYSKVAGINNFMAARYHSNGSLDTTFNGTGYSRTLVGTVSGGYSIGLQADSKIILGGGASVGDGRFAVVRFNSNGSLDTTFGTAGSVTTDFTAFGDQIAALQIQSDGRIIAAGVANLNIAIARYR